MSQTKITDAVRDVTAVDATKLTGAVDVARLPSTVLNSNVPATDTSILEYNIAILAFKVASANQLAKFSMVDQVIDEYQDATGVDAGNSTNEIIGGSGTAKYFEGAIGGNDPTGGASVDTSVTGYKTHVFTSDASLVVASSGNVDILVVAGGGSGGQHYGGGGGAGGLIYKTGHALTANTYDAVIGNGGTGIAAGSSSLPGNAGANSTWTINGGATQFTAVGGGFGGNTDGGSGGSGGGSGHNQSGSRSGGAGTQTTAAYVTGNRSSDITVTTDISMYAGTPAGWVDGNTSTNTSITNATAVVGKYIRFEFATTRTYTGHRFYNQNNGAENAGTWKWQGSNTAGGASGYTDISDSFVLSNNTTPEIISFSLSGTVNSTAYLYYQLLGVSGNADQETLSEMEFAGTLGDSETYGFGFAGGLGSPAPNYNVPGGGGAGSVGADADANKSGNGGTGKDYSAIFGTAVGDSGWFASGGGGGATADGTTVAGTASNGGGTDGGASGAYVSAAAQANTGGGSGGGGDTGGSGLGGKGVILVRYATDAFLTSGANLTLQSTETTAESAPTTANLVVLIEDSGSGTADLAADIKAKVSRDGSAFTGYVTFTDEGNWGTDKRILRSNDIDLTGINTGTSMRYKIETFNQSAGVKETRIHATSLAWA